jgi:hypothetical protein
VIELSAKEKGEDWESTTIKLYFKKNKLSVKLFEKWSVM